MERIHYADDGRVARVTLDRPPLNVLTATMLQELCLALEGAARVAALRVLVLGAEGKAFSAGAAAEGPEPGSQHALLEALHRVIRQLWALDCVTLAAVQGPALGCGAELAAFCDLVIASEAASFGQPELRADGFPLSAGLGWSRRIGGPRTLALLVAGTILRARKAAHLGLVDQVLTADGFRPSVEAEVQRLAALSAPALRATKRAVRDSAALSLDEALSLVDELHRCELGSGEGLRPYVEQRKPIWTDS